MDAFTAGVGRALLVGVPRPERGTRADVVVVDSAAAAVAVSIAMIAVLIVQRPRGAELQLGLLQQMLPVVARSRSGGGALGGQGDGFRARLETENRTVQSYSQLRDNGTELD